MREVTLSELTYFNLARHHLLERAPRDRALQVIDDVLGLNAQGALNYHVSLWSRVEGLSNGFIGESLESRALIRCYSVRGTVHVAPVSLYVLVNAALRDHLVSGFERQLDKSNLMESGGLWRQYAQEVLEALGDQPSTVSELVGRLGWRHPEAKRLMNALVRLLGYRGELCHAASGGPWYVNTENTYVRMDAWLPGQIYVGDGGEARAQLAERYLKAYGPATVSDFRYWTGLSASLAKGAFKAIEGKLIKVMSQECGKLFLLEEDLDALLGVEPMEMVRLLPAWDALIMGHADKTRIMDPEHRKQVFLRLADVAPTLLIDGRVAGTWSMKKGRGEAWGIKVESFSWLGELHSDLLEEEAERLRGFTGFGIELSAAR